MNECMNNGLILSFLSRKEENDFKASFLKDVSCDCFLRSAAAINCVTFRMPVFYFQTMKIKLQTPSASQLPPFNPLLPPSAITQIMLVANPLKVSFYEFMSLAFLPLSAFAFIEACFILIIHTRQPTDDRSVLQGTMLKTYLKIYKIY